MRRRTVSERLARMTGRLRQRLTSPNKQPLNTVAHEQSASQNTTASAPSITDVVNCHFSWSKTHRSTEDAAHNSEARHNSARNYHGKGANRNNQTRITAKTTAPVTSGNMKSKLNIRKVTSETSEESDSRERPAGYGNDLPFQLATFSTVKTNIQFGRRRTEEEQVAPLGSRVVGGFESNQKPLGTRLNKWVEFITTNGVRHQPSHVWTRACEPSTSSHHEDQSNN